MLGVGVNAIDMESAVKFSDSLIRSNGQGYICVTGVHGIIEAQSDPEFLTILNSSYLTTPDGMPTVWVGRLQGFSGMRRVYGPDYMMEMCRLSVTRGYRHFLYGGQPGVAQALADVLRRKFSGIEIVGAFTPPFQHLNAIEEDDLIAAVRKTQPDILWVGLSTPKQERFMNEYLGRLDVHLMVGVGAAFDIHTGRIKDAPTWIKLVGLQWAHRLLQEPRRLWKRYVINNPAFLWCITLQFFGIRRYGINR